MPEEKNEPVGKSGIALNQKRGSVVGHLPYRGIVEMPDI